MRMFRGAGMGAALAGVMFAAASPAEAQRGRDVCAISYDSENYFKSPWFTENPVYDGRVTFLRIKYTGGFECNSEEGPGWAHDYPITESHFVKIMESITTIHPFVKHGRVEGSAIFSWKDPQVFKYPIAWISEPGGWNMNGAELAGFKKYIERGGFIIFDDIGWRNRPDLIHLMNQWRRAFPNAEMTELKPDHQIFNSFFQVDLSKITSYSNRSGTYGTGPQSAQYFAIYQDNDPRKRMLAVINNNQDLGEFMQFSDQAFNIVPSNEAYKLTINYFIYALTH
jgi:hypothetical protein